MRIKEGFVLRELLGEFVVTAEGIERVNFNKIITLNPSAAYLWNQVVDCEFTAETLANLLMERYEVSEEVALNDSEALIESWKNASLIDD